MRSGRVAACLVEVKTVVDIGDRHATDGGSGAESAVEQAMGMRRPSPQAGRAIEWGRLTKRIMPLMAFRSQARGTPRTLRDKTRLIEEQIHKRSLAYLPHLVLFIIYIQATCRCLVVPFVANFELGHLERFNRNSISTNCHFDQFFLP